MAEHENGNIARHITEDEAALYDRQIRLWGLEAQQRMRNATICVINLRGVATEVIKNIVLSGIGKLIAIDAKDVSQEDLGAGFFFREKDLGKKRVQVARSRIENLNPLVVVETISEPLSYDRWNSVIMGVDIVCLTDGSREDLGRINELCRKNNKPFYAGGSYGLKGYIFSDLLTHEYISPDRTTTPPDGQPKSIKRAAVYPTFSEALKHNWQTLTKKQCRQQNVELVLSILALWKYQSRHRMLPSDANSLNDLDSIAKGFISAARIRSEVMSSIPMDYLRELTSTVTHEFSPVCAVIGGLMAQDMLKALSGREPPIANLFVFDGKTGSGAVSRLNMSE